MQDSLFDKARNWWAAFSEWSSQGLKVVPIDDYTPLLDISGFLGILAFSVAVFTLSGPKFQIRQSTAIFPFRPLFFGTLVVSAIITFTVEAFVMYGVSFPKFVEPNTVNFIITATIAILILYWMKICFVSPPRFTRFTARHFCEQTFWYVANGSREELLALSRELMREIPRLVLNSPVRQNNRLKDDGSKKWTIVEGYANDLLLILSDPRFCDVVAEEIPTFPAYLVEQMVDLERYDAPASLIVRRIVIALLAKPGSALFVENEWLEQGFTGKIKPITRAIFRNWHKIEPHERGIESPLDMDYPYALNWDTETWRVYFSLAREYVRGLSENEYWHTNTRGIDHVLKTTQRAYEQIGALEKYDNTFDAHNPYWHALEANRFLNDLVKTLDEADILLFFDRNDKYLYGSDISSKIANVTYGAIYYASGVNTKEFRMWEVQHNLVWSPIERHEVEDTKIMKMVRRKLRRMIWAEITNMDKFPNYKGARYIRYCMNVLGFYDEKTHRKDGSKRDSWALAKVVSVWVRKNYQTIATTYPPVAEAMLPANIEYDAERQILVRTKDDSLTGVPRKMEFALDPPRVQIE